MATAVDTDLDGAADAAFEAAGESVTVGETAATAIVTGASLDSQFVSGGTGEAGGKSITLRKSDFATAPAKMTRCIVRGQTLQITSVAERLRTWRCDLQDVSTR